MFSTTQSRFPGAALALLLCQLNMVVGQDGGTNQARSNGNLWYVFGPAIVAVAETAFIQAEFREGIVARKIQEPTQLARLKEFLKKRVLSEINSSPVEPVFGSVEPKNYVSLYAGSEMEPDSLLVSIPITDETIQKGVRLDDVLSEFLVLVRAK